MVLAKLKSRSLLFSRKADCTKFTYDAAMNRRMKIDSTARTTYTCDAGNQLQWTQDGTGRTTYTYDQAGNQALQLAPNLDRTTQVWDAENRMTQMRHPNATRSTYTYNGDNLRVKAEEPTATSKIIWDGQIYLIETDGTNATQATYTNEPNAYGYLLSQRRSSTTSFYHADSPGSVTNLTNSSATVTDSNLYKAFGEIIASSGATVNPFRYNGISGYYLVNQLYYVIKEWYSPANSRWISAKHESTYGIIDYCFLVNSPTGSEQYFISTHDDPEIYICCKFSRVVNKRGQVINQEHAQTIPCKRSVRMAPKDPNDASKGVAGMIACCKEFQDLNRMYSGWKVVLLEARPCELIYFPKNPPKVPDPSTKFCKPDDTPCVSVCRSEQVKAGDTCGKLWDPRRKIACILAAFYSCFEDCMAACLSIDGGGPEKGKKAFDECMTPFQVEPPKKPK